MDTSLGMSIQGYNNRKLKKQKMIQKGKRACAEFEGLIRKTWGLESWTAGGGYWLLIVVAFYRKHGYMFSL
jgi:hypothetical protein